MSSFTDGRDATGGFYHQFYCDKYAIILSKRGFSAAVRTDFKGSLAGFFGPLSSSLIKLQLYTQVEFTLKYISLLNA